MKRSKKIIIYLSISIVLIVMLSLFYYSMHATILEFFFENDQKQLDSATSANGDQAQIMVDLANKQLAKQKADTEARKAEKQNTSIFKELSGNKATVKEPSEKIEESSSSSNIVAKERPKSNHVQNGFVVVDCETGGVVACPHGEVLSGTSPMYYKNNKSPFLVGHCSDLSIDVKSFCPQATIPK
ncbi:hypothetical protein MNBD_GAMMA22-212 [hydrothermal vent metagenome]|uniref:Uncharacterized protein n=1 Tax=hydrothermal vent metagenome TaxID=652676 RepID=A0A3B0ZBV1_9ZZZZ